LATKEAAMLPTVTARRSASTGPALLTTPAFLAVTLASLAYFTGDGVLIPAVPRYVQGPLAAGDVAVGLVVGAFSLSAFFLRPWVGGLGDRWGRRPLMVVGAGLFTASVLGYPAASSPAALAGLRLLTGAGEACFFVGALTAVADLAPARRRGEAMSFASLALYVGIGVGPLLGEVAIERSGFAAAWALAGVAWPPPRSRCWPPRPAPMTAARLRPARRPATTSSTQPGSCRGCCCSPASSAWPGSWPSSPCTPSTSGWTGPGSCC
jgi:MFS family permease